MLRCPHPCPDVSPPIACFRLFRNQIIELFPAAVLLWGLWAQCAVGCWGVHPFPPPLSSVLPSPAARPVSPHVPAGAQHAPCHRVSHRGLTLSRLTPRSPSGLLLSHLTLYGPAPPRVPLWPGAALGINAWGRGLCGSGRGLGVFIGVGYEKGAWPKEGKGFGCAAAPLPSGSGRAELSRAGPWGRSSGPCGPTNRRWRPD